MNGTATNAFAAEILRTMGENTARSWQESKVIRALAARHGESRSDKGKSVGRVGPAPKEAIHRFSKALAEDFAPVRERLADILKAKDDDELKDKLEAFNNWLSKALPVLIQNPLAARTLAMMQADAAMAVVRKPDSKPGEVKAAEAVTTGMFEWAKRNLLPTSFSTEQIRENFSKEILSKSIFSARTQEASYLLKVQETVDELLKGNTNLASASNTLQEKLDELSYKPDAPEGSLLDLSSDVRTRLVLNTNLRMAANRGLELDSSDAVSLHIAPCWELVRFYDREVPRGYKMVKGQMVEDPGEDWPSRWQECGGELVDGERMVARKDDEIWSELGDSGRFDDATDSDVPPFAFNSGFDWREVGRQEAVRLGVIESDEEVGPRESSLLGGLDDVGQIMADTGSSRDELVKALGEIKKNLRVKVSVK